MLSDQAIRIEGDRIVGIGDFKANAAERVIDWSAFTVLPGLMDMFATGTQQSKTRAHGRGGLVALRVVPQNLIVGGPRLRNNF